MFLLYLLYLYRLMRCPVETSTGPYEIRVISQILFYFFSKFCCFHLNFSGFRVFPVKNFLDSFLIIKLNYINQKAFLIH